MLQCEEQMVWANSNTVVRERGVKRKLCFSCLRCVKRLIAGQKGERPFFNVSSLHTDLWTTSSSLGAVDHCGSSAAAEPSMAGWLARQKTQDSHLCSWGLRLWSQPSFWVHERAVKHRQGQREEPTIWCHAPLVRRQVIQVIFQAPSLTLCNCCVLIMEICRKNKESKVWRQEHFILNLYVLFFLEVTVISPV